MRVTLVFLLASALCTALAHAKTLDTRVYRLGNGNEIWIQLNDPEPDKVLLKTQGRFHAIFEGKLSGIPQFEEDSPAPVRKESPLMPIPHAESTNGVVIGIEKNHFLIAEDGTAYRLDPRESLPRVSVGYWGLGYSYVIGIADPANLNQATKMILVTKTTGESNLRDLTHFPDRSLPLRVGSVTTQVRPPLTINGASSGIIPGSYHFGTKFGTLPPGPPLPEDFQLKLPQGVRDRNSHVDFPFINWTLHYEFKPSGQSRVGFKVAGRSGTFRFKDQDTVRRLSKIELITLPSSVLIPQPGFLPVRTIRSAVGPEVAFGVSKGKLFVIGPTPEGQPQVIITNIPVDATKAQRIEIQFLEKDLSGIKNDFFVSVFDDEPTEGAFEAPGATYLWSDPDHRNVLLAPKAFRLHQEAHETTARISLDSLGRIIIEDPKQRVLFQRELQTLDLPKFAALQSMAMPDETIRSWFRDEGLAPPDELMLHQMNTFYWGDENRRQVFLESARLFLLNPDGSALPEEKFRERVRWLLDLPVALHFPELIDERLGNVSQGQNRLFFETFIHGPFAKEAWLSQPSAARWISIMQKDPTLLKSLQGLVYNVSLQDSHSASTRAALEELEKIGEPLGPHLLCAIRKVLAERRSATSN